MYTKKNIFIDNHIRNYVKSVKIMNFQFFNLLMAQKHREKPLLIDTARQERHNLVVYQ